jgi:hypothetical protein
MGIENGSGGGIRPGFDIRLEQFEFTIRLLAGRMKSIQFPFAAFRLANRELKFHRLVAECRSTGGSLGGGDPFKGSFAHSHPPKFSSTSFFNAVMAWCSSAPSAWMMISSSWFTPEQACHDVLALPLFHLSLQ